MLLMMLSITVCIALIGGATMAWFTNKAELDANAFTAGTVEISADGGVVSNNEKIENVNPGDCFKLEWDIENVGTKKIQLRAIINAKWIDTDEVKFSEDNILILPQKGSKWVFYQPEDKKGPNKPIYAYYLGGPIDGTYGKEEGEENDIANLELVLYFDGERTTNKYQGASFEIDVDFEAVQASNGAPSAVWGNDGWDAVNDSEYEFLYENWKLVEEDEIDLDSIACYGDKEDPEDPEEPEDPEDPEAPEDPEDPEDPEEPEVPANIASFTFTRNYKTVYVTENGRTVAKYQIYGEIKEAKDENGNNFTGKKDISLEVKRSILEGNGVMTAGQQDVEFTDGKASYSILFDHPISNFSHYSMTIDGVTVTKY